MAFDLNEIEAAAKAATDGYWTAPNEHDYCPYPAEILALVEVVRAARRLIEAERAMGEALMTYRDEDVVDRRRLCHNVETLALAALREALGAFGDSSSGGETA